MSTPLAHSPCDFLKVKTLPRMRRVREAKFADFFSGLIKIYLIGSLVPV